MEDIIEFNGIKYRRYPKSKNDSDTKYYITHKSDEMRGYGYLHRDVWKFYNG